MLLTARGEDVDRIVGLEIGADDYLPKPFNPRELLARVRAILRRGMARQATEAEAKYLEAAGIALDMGARMASCKGVGLELTDVEFELLKALVSAPGEVLTRETLTETVLERKFHPFDRSLDMHVSRLRRKLEEAAGEGERIKTIRATGYQLAMPSVHARRGA